MSRVQVNPEVAKRELENVERHFRFITELAHRASHLNLSIVSYSFRTVRDTRETVVFARHRTMVRFDVVTASDALRVQRAETPVGEWAPDWSKVEAKTSPWPERGPPSWCYEEMYKLLLEAFAP